MQTEAFQAPLTDGFATELDSDDFFDLEWSAAQAALDDEEIGAGFDFSAYERALNFRRKALRILGLGSWVL